MSNYILKGKTPVLEPDLMKWARWYEKGEGRIVKRTQVDDEVRVSTVFLGIDHAFSGGTPILFETMIFGGEHDGYQERCSTWEEAEAQHEEAVKLIFQV